MEALLGQLDRLLYSPAGRWCAAALSGLAAALVPVSCVACGAPDQSLCSGCAARIRRGTLHPFYAQEGAGALPAAEPQERPSRTVFPSRAPADRATEPFIPMPVLASGVYAGGLARTLLAFKNRGHTDLAGFLVPMLAGVLHAAVRDVRRGFGGDRQLVLVPVPGTGSSLRRRGYVPLALLLRRLRHQRLLPPGCTVAFLVSPAPGNGPAGTMLRALGGGGTPAGGSPSRRSGSSPQKGLGRSARRRNVRGTMTAGPPGALAGTTCLVLDDVLTTGATIAETARALRCAGARVLGAVVLAATPAPARNTTPTYPAVPGVPAAGGGNGIQRRE